jgi:hypothetical protein
MTAVQRRMLAVAGAYPPLVFAAVVASCGGRAAATATGRHAPDAAPGDHADASASSQSSASSSDASDAFPQDRQVVLEPADAGLPAREAGTGVVSDRCGQLRPWIPPSGMQSVTVLKGGDGFAGLLPDGGLVSPGSVYLYDAHASARLRVGRIASHDGQLGVEKAVDAEGNATALVSCSYKFPCGNYLLVAGRAPMVLNRWIGTLPPSGLALFDPYLTAGPDGAIVLSGLIGTPTGLGSTPFAIESAETIETVDRTGNVLTKMKVAALDYDLRDIEFDRNQRGLVLLYQTHTPNGDAGAKAQSLVVALDSNFVERARWYAPAGVTVSAIEPDRRGRVIVAGTRRGFGADQVWLDALDVTTLTEAWSVPHLDGSGAALAVDVASTGAIVTMGQTSTMGTLWLQRFDANGIPTLPDRLTESASTLAGANWFLPSIAEQSDGSVFISTGREGFVYCQ